MSACELDTRTDGPIDAFTRQRSRLCAATPDSPRMHSTTLRMIVLRRGLADQFGEAATICVNRGAQQASPNLGGRTYGDQNEVFTAAAYLDLVRSYCSSRPGPKDYICFALADEAPPFAETDVERIYLWRAITKDGTRGAPDTPR